MIPALRLRVETSSCYHAIRLANVLSRTSEGFCNAIRIAIYAIRQGAPFSSIRVAREVIGAGKYVLAQDLSLPVSQLRFFGQNNVLCSLKMNVSSSVGLTANRCYS